MTTPDGVVTSYASDDLKRRTDETVARGTSDITEHKILDSVGRVLQRQRIAGGPTITLERFEYDALGLTYRKYNGLDGLTQQAETTASGFLVRTTTNPNNGQRVETYNKDGTLKSVTGSSVLPVFYEYGVWEGGAWSQETKGTATGDEWVKTYSEYLGRTVKTTYSPRLTGTTIDTEPPYSQSFYNAQGQLWKQRDPDDVITLFCYNAQGEQAFVITVVSDSTRGWTSYSDVETAINGGTLFDVNNVDRITRTTNYVLASSDANNSRGVDIQRADRYVWKDGEADGTLVSRSETSANGLATWSTVYPNGGAPAVTSQSATEIPSSGNNWTRTTTQFAPDGSQTVSKFQYGQMQSVTRKDDTANHLQVTKTAYGYDAHGRQSTLTDARNGTTTYVFISDVTG